MVGGTPHRLEIQYVHRRAVQPRRAHGLGGEAAADHRAGAALRIESLAQQTRAFMHAACERDREAIQQFPVNRQQMLLAYEWNSKTRVLLMLGAHENFYRDLKRK